MSTITVAPYRINLDGSVSATGTAASAIDPSYTEVLSEPGSGSVTFQNDDPLLAALAMDGRDLLQFRVDDVPVWVMWPDPAKIISIAQGEGAAEQTILSGPGHLALLDKMRVYPPGEFTDDIGPLPFVRERFYNWTTFDFDESTWDDAKEILLVGYAKATWPIPWAEDFPDDNVLIIWADNPLGNTSDYLSADEGRCRFRYKFTPPEEGIYRALLTADNDAKLYIDSALVGETDTFTSTTQIDFSLSADEHIIALDVHNGAWLPGLDSGPGGVALKIYEVTLAGLVSVTYTFSGYQVLAYQDDPPGVTPGYAYGLFLDEGQARGVLPLLDRDWDATLDSNGTPWDEVADVSTGVNTGGLDFLRQMCGTYFDARMDPDLSAGLVLHLYGEMGTSSGVTYARGVNLTSLEHQRENVPVNGLLIEGADRWLTRTDTASVAAHGRSESSLDAGAPASTAEVFRIADGQLDVYAHPREEIVAGIEPGAGEVPGVDVLLGDTAVIPDSTGVSDDERMVSITVTEDPKSRRAVFTCSFRDVILGDQERLIRIAKSS